MALCENCLAFDIQSFRSAPFQTRGYRRADVEQRAKSKACVFCAFLCQAVSAELQKVVESSEEPPDWIHLRMSEDYNAPSKSVLDYMGTSAPLRFNRMDVLLSRRRPLFTTPKPGEAAWGQPGVQCRVLSDPRTSY